MGQEKNKFDAIDVLALGLMGINPIFLPVVLGIYATRHSQTVADTYIALERYVKGGPLIENPSVAGVLTHVTEDKRYQLPPPKEKDMSHRYMIAIQRKIQNGQREQLLNEFGKLTTTKPQHLDVIGESGSGKTVLVEMIRESLEINYGQDLRQILIDPKADDSWGIPSSSSGINGSVDMLDKVAKTLQKSDKVDQFWKLIMVDELPWLLEEGDSEKVMSAIKIISKIGRSKRVILVIMRQTSESILDESLRNNFTSIVLGREVDKYLGRQSYPNQIQLEKEVLACRAFDSDLRFCLVDRNRGKASIELIPQI